MVKRERERERERGGGAGGRQTDTDIEANRYNEKRHTQIDAVTEVKKVPLEETNRHRYKGKQVQPE